MNANASPQRRARLACIAAAAAWVVALAVFVVAFQRSARHEAARDRHLALLKQLEPDLKTLNAYRETLARLAAQSATETVEPDFASFLATTFPAARPASLETRTDRLPATGLRLRTATAKWSDIPMPSFAALVAAAETATPPFRLSAVTLAPAGVGERQNFKAEASFISILH
jgi:hypothetical protein